MLGELLNNPLSQFTIRLLLLIWCQSSMSVNYGVLDGIK